MAAPSSGVTVRMYRTGFGDCFLLAFRGDDGQPVYMLIDCGVHNRYPEGSDQIAKVVKHLRGSVDELAVIAVTHEHADHISGFGTCRDDFKAIPVGEVWFSWTEKPGDPVVEELKDRRQRMFMALKTAEQKLAGMNDTARENINSLLGFFDYGLGMSGAKTMDFIRERSSKRRYLKPKRRPLSIPGVSGVRVFVLGPPVERDYLMSPNPKREPGQVYSEMALTSALLAANSDAGKADTGKPFAGNYRILADVVRKQNKREEYRFFREHYGFDDDAPDKWRRIDSDWLYAAESLALKLDAATNNTSLVLAIELPNTKRVLLFPGDAQVGNWESWHKGGWSERNGLAKGEKITAKDLLARTVFYKVGHHGSHNATLRRRGLEMMTSDELVAMIPVDQKWAEALVPYPWKMPFGPLYKDLETRTHGRIKRTDHLDEDTLYDEFTIEDCNPCTPLRQSTPRKSR